jgi:thiamine pyrophosphokinase
VATPTRPSLEALLWLGAPATREKKRRGPFARVGSPSEGSASGTDSGTRAPANKRVIAVDGGLKGLLESTGGGIFLPPDLARNWLWVGDGDSLHARDPRSFFAPGALEGPTGIELRTLPLPVDKDVSDFGAALDALTSEVENAGIGSGGSVVVSVEGGLGGRRDHELCNLLEAADFLVGLSALGLHGVVDFEGRIVCFSGGVKLCAPGGTTFSLCSLRGGPELHLAGACYGGELVLGRGSRGLSNVVAGTIEGSLVARAHATDAVFVFVCAEEYP